MNRTEIKEEILRIFDELSPEDQADFYEKAKALILVNSAKAE